MAVAEAGTNHSHLPEGEVAAERAAGHFGHLPKLGQVDPEAVEARHSCGHTEFIQSV